MPQYPRLLRRVRAALIDSVLFVVLFFLWLFLVGFLESAHPAIKIAPLLIGLLILEPGLVAWTGGTPGHHSMGLRIRDSLEDRKIGLLRATLRALVRTLLGWVSLVFILVTRRHQALHDYVSRTVVVLRDPSRLPESERFAERSIPEGYEFPGWARRLGVILLYGAISYAIATFIVVALVEDTCLYSNICNTADDVVIGVVGLGWFAAFIAIIVLACRGQLFGCRRRQISESAGNRGAA